MVYYRKLSASTSSRTTRCCKPNTNDYSEVHWTDNQKMYTMEPITSGRDGLAKESLVLHSEI